MQASAAMPLAEPPNHRKLTPLFSLTGAVNVQLAAQAALGTNHKPKSKTANRAFERRPRHYLELKSGTTKCPLPAPTT
jgi:hypothetical protein